MIRNYGLHFAEPDPKAYTLGGAIELPKVILQSNSQWDWFLPSYEAQYNDNYDSSGCTVWGTENIVETYLKRLTGQDYNFSERFIYILANITPPGADPHYVAEVIRANGLIQNDLLPMTDSFEEFLTPKPMTEELKKAGTMWGYTLKHQYVWRAPQTKSERFDKIKEALQYSPLGVSVTAWIEKDGVYVDDGQPNTHWCELYGWNDKGYKIFDSYDHSEKILSFDHNIQVCKRYYLEPKLPKKSWLGAIGHLWQRLIT